MAKQFRPLLAATVKSTDIHRLRLPLIGSPKLDGIRVVMHPQLGPVTRKLKPVPNRYIRERLSELTLPLDGEILCGEHDAEVFNRTSSAVMSEDGEPDFTYWVFDLYKEGPYVERLTDLRNMTKLPDFVRVLKAVVIDTLDDLEKFENDYVARGFEGIMLRSPAGKYKFNRSTLNEQYLMKLKRFEDADATITGFEEKTVNKNPARLDERGYSKRSTHKANQIPAGVLGSFVCTSSEFPGLTFNVGSGFTEQQRVDFWKRREALVGYKIKFKFQRVGVKDAPRFPVFLGLRFD